uniref:TRMT1-like protein n=1 Tax=Ciona intestinalis TaxID=7719 RepID=UPI000180D0E4|nr:TRMT1-like protein [Ciona intestinalis]|eukprot:XP_026691407.1 TRMT1-like protein [Ciona intestinalis]
MNLLNGKLVENNAEIPLVKSYEDVMSFKRVSKVCELGLSRAIALACLEIVKLETDGVTSALDAVNSFGAAGMQWAKHFLSENISITVNTALGLDDVCKKWLNENNCPTDSVKVVSMDPQVLMHSSKHKFVYLEVTGTVVPYLDAAVRSVNHNGLLCVTCTDTSTLYNKCPTTAQRLYGANLLKNEYCKEVAIRVIISNIAQSAARWNKGIKVELCASVEPGFTVVCRVLRGPKHGDISTSSIQLLEHCQLCQARRFKPRTKYITYGNGKTLCKCSTEEAAAPLLLLGPMWSGSIFQPEFVLKTCLTAKQMNLSLEHRKILELILLESVCCKTNEEEENLLKHTTQFNGKNQLNEKSEPKHKKIKLDSEVSSENGPSLTKEMRSYKHIPFYCDFQHHSVKGGNPPRLLTVLNELRSRGYNASKTHFGPRCIRTSASVEQFDEILKHLWEVTTKHNGIKV